VRADELEKMFGLEDTYWWFVARRRLVRDLLARHLGRPDGSARPLRILDVGCGTGATFQVLEGYGRPVGIDRSPEALRYCRRRGDHALVLARGEALPVQSSSVDAITALDLLEHIAEDGEAMRESARALRPGGLLVVTVPALPWLWSEHDEALDHLRRYRAGELRRALEQAGLEVVRLSPVITLLLLPIGALRLAQRAVRRRRTRPQTAFIIPPRAANWLLTALLWLENQWALRWNLPVGVSLMAVARKPAIGLHDSL
jgi:SAM-dependent methyltransferase